MRRHSRRAAGRAARDDGMTLIEVVVALGLFAVMSTAALSVLVSAITTTRDDKARMEAVNLASRELEIVRDTFSSVLRGPDGVGDATNPDQLVGGLANGPIIVDNVAYTVTRETRWESVGDGVATPCDDGTSDELAYLHVTVKVTWPALGTRPPVTMDTLLTPPKGTYSTLQTQSHIGIKVIDADGKPQAGVRVSATSTVGTAGPELTESDGCALLEHLRPGDWTATVSNPGYVSPSGDATAQIRVHLEASQLWRGTIEYDKAATIQASFVAPTGYELPQGVDHLPVTIGNSGLQPIGARVLTDPVALAAAQLWPYPSGYEVWAGGCQDGGPAATGNSNLVTVVPGLPTPATIMLGPLEVTAAPGAHATAIHLPDPATSDSTVIPDPLCTHGLNLDLGDAGADGTLRTSLPYGAWAIVAGSNRVEVTVSPDATQVNLTGLAGGATP
jgi:prepilin-type N-terminal cleavage/methylation domain-containing protein